MKLIECYIKSFGGIKELHIEFDRGLNCFIGENGAGKSTIAAFIKAMLYGLGESRKASIEENDRKHYLPWDGGCAVGSLTFSARGRTYRAERSFGKRPSEDSFALYDVGLGRRCEDLGENIGEELFGIDAEGFERTVFFSEKNLIPEADGSSFGADRPDDAVEDELSRGALNEALSVLDEQRKIYQKKGGGGLIADTRAELFRLKEELGRLESVASRAREYEVELGELTARRSLLEKRFSDISKRQSALGEQLYARKYEDKIREIKKECLALDRRKDELFAFFGGNIPTAEGLAELSYKRTRAEELKFKAMEQRREGDEYKSLSCGFEGKIDETDAVNARAALSAIDSASDEKSQRIREIFKNRIPTHAEAKAVSLMRGRAHPIGVIFCVFGALILGVGAALGFLVSGALFALCAVGCALSAVGIAVSAVSSAISNKKARRKQDEFLSSLGGAQLLPPERSAALCEVLSLIDDAEKIENSLAQADEVLEHFCAKFSARVGDKTEFVRAILDRFDRMKELSARELMRDEIDPMILSERLMMEVAEALAIYDISTDDPLKEVKDALKEYEAVTSELVLKAKELATVAAMRGLSTDGSSTDTEEELQRERSEATRERTAIDGEIAIRTREYEADMQQLLSRESLLVELGIAEEHLTIQEDELRTVLLTREYLSRAAERLRERYLAGAAESFKKYAARLGICHGRPEMASDFSTSVADGAGTRSTEYYNRAARDGYRLAARLAIIDTLYKGEEPFILLDDPFASFDDKRCALATELLSELGEARQTVYFTCSESRATKGARRLRSTQG